MSGRRSSTQPVVGWVGALTITALFLAGCGSTSPTARSTVTPSGAPPAAQVSTSTGSLGVFLVNSQGQTLYMTDADPEGSSGCYDECATTWPPLATTGDPVASGAVVAKELTTSTRTDAITQVVYGGHPLYTYSLDGAPGQTTGQGLVQQGGTWWVVGTDGAPIKNTPAASATASS
jgi:predicted lipoprotein with Yx(FWY)xxD motif